MNKELSDAMDTVIEISNIVSEMWTGTQYEKRIGSERAHLIKIYESGDFDATFSGIADFMMFLDRAERAYGRADEVKA